MVIVFFVKFNPENAQKYLRQDFTGEVESEYLHLIPEGDELYKKAELDGYNAIEFRKNDGTVLNRVDIA